MIKGDAITQRSYRKAARAARSMALIALANGEEGTTSKKVRQNATAGARQDFESVGHPARPIKNTLSGTLSASTVSRLSMVRLL